MTPISILIGRVWHLLTLAVFVLLTLTASSLPPGDPYDRVRGFTRSLEFDFVTWTLDALAVKLTQVALGTLNYLPVTSRSQIVLEYLDLVREIDSNEILLRDIYADPDILDPETTSNALRNVLEAQYNRRNRLGPLAEAAIQSQLGVTLNALDLSLGGQPVPPVLYHTTPIPLALIVSPRDAIHQEANISLLPGLTIDQREALEAQIDQSLDVSSLVVPVGGIGTYPTMVMQTSDVNWLAEVVAHEWTHNFLTLRPLGVNVFESPELLTMNETAANIAGKELGRVLIGSNYPEFLPPPPPPTPSAPIPQVTTEPPEFDFRAEMRITRVTVDELLAAGKIEEAEAYMRARQAVFWEQGYRHIRKINQAYFAFYGSYADQPGGAAGDDPVGAAVRTLRAQSPSLASFLNQISWMTSPDDLFQAVRDR